MTAVEVVREYFPDADESFVDYVLWCRTSLPAGNHTGTPEGDLRKACLALKEAKEKGVVLCEMCDEPATHDNLCKSCHDVLVW